MNIKDLKGSVSDQEFLESFLTHGNFKSIGEVWEKNIDCNHCVYKDQCQFISDQIQDMYDVSTYCRQIINYLLGDMPIEGFLKED